jgi:folate-binding protein YgfZ
MLTQRAAWNDLLGKIAVPELALPGASASDRPLLALLPHLSAVAVTGEDARSYLQKQFTNDLDEVTDARGQLTGACTPKGRLVSVARVTRWPGGFLLRVPNSNAPSLIEQLTKYRLRARVEIEEIDVVAIGIARRDVSAFGWRLAADHDVQPLDDAVIERVPFDRYEIVGTASTVAALWPSLVEGATLSGPEGWVALDIAAGTPFIVPATEEAFVPQMVNLDAVSGVSFTKGCYPGQEIVARLKYLGTLKRRMFRAWIDGTNRPVPGDDISAEGASGAAAGKVVASAPATGGGIDLLVSLQLSARNGSVHVGGERLEWRDLPYDLGLDSAYPSRDAPSEPSTDRP